MGYIVRSYNEKVKDFGRQRAKEAKRVVLVSRRGARSEEEEEDFLIAWRRGQGCNRKRVTKKEWTCVRVGLWKVLKLKRAVLNLGFLVSCGVLLLHPPVTTATLYCCCVVNCNCKRRWLVHQVLVWFRPFPFRRKDKYTLINI